MIYKILATDMDGTLLKNNKTISPRNLASLREAKKKGMEIIICTGRPYGSLKPYLDQLGFPCWVVTNNGAVVRSKDNQVVQVINLKKLPSQRAMEILNEEGIYYHATDPYYAYINSYWERVKVLQKFIKKKNVALLNSWVQALWSVFLSGTHRRVNQSNYIEKQGVISSIFVYSRDLAHLQRVRQRLEGMADIHITSSEKHNFEILDTYATKGLALKKIAEEMGITSNEVIAVGDNYNDLSMIEYAGLGVAMANGEVEVLKRADYVTKSNEEDGIKDLLENIFQGKIEKSCKPVGE